MLGEIMPENAQRNTVWVRVYQVLKKEFENSLKYTSGTHYFLQNDY